MVTVRLMLKSDIPQLISIWKELKFSLGAHTIDTFFEVDPNGFYVAVENETVVGCCSTVIYSHDFATIGLYSVHPSYQGKGIGLKTWKKAMEHIGERNCFLNSMPDYFHMYRNKAGFTFLDTRNTFVWKNNAVSADQLIEDVKDVVVEPLNQTTLERVIAYDEQVAGHNRAKILTTTMHEKRCVSLVATKDGKVCGYGCLKDNIMGGKLLGPLYADDPDVAELILRRHLEMIPLSRQCYLTYMGIDSNPSVELAKKLGLEKVCTLPRLYTKVVLDAKFDSVYSQMDLGCCNI